MSVISKAAEPHTTDHPLTDVYTADAMEQMKVINILSRQRVRLVCLRWMSMDLVLTLRNSIITRNAYPVLEIRGNNWIDCAILSTDSSMPFDASSPGLRLLAWDTCCAQQLWRSCDPYNNLGVPSSWHPQRLAAQVLHFGAYGLDQDIGALDAMQVGMWRWHWGGVSVTNAPSLHSLAPLYHRSCGRHDQGGYAVTNSLERKGSYQVVASSQGAECTP